MAVNLHCQIAPNVVADTAAPGANQPLQTRLAFFVARQHTASRRRGVPPVETIPPRVHRVAPASDHDITENNMKPTLLALSLAGLGLTVSGLAHAVNVDVNIGTAAPVIVAPAPAVIVGWHGDRYWDGRRYWERREWEDHERGYRHEPRGGYHCPPGHAKKGEC
ncbi:hypothetical protein LGM38_24390 [Burkholderia vietnamiensis]|nr:hypothetical protein [Burkholderia vietnamiensis]MCA8226050.1 hypothetical protein [Burkholderia vietnamiensis]